MSETLNTTPSVEGEPKVVVPPENASEVEHDVTMKSKRKKALSIVALIVLVVAIIYLIWSFIFSHTVSTDNAYVGAESAEITSMVSGQVTGGPAEDSAPPPRDPC